MKEHPLSDDSLEALLPPFTRRDFGTLLGAGACLAAWPAQAAIPMPPRWRNFGEMMGLGVKFSQGQPIAQLENLRDLGVRWVREHLAWEVIEPTAGRYAEFGGVLKAQLDFYKRHDIALVALLSLGNFAAYPPTAEDPARPYHVQAFGRYAAQVCRMLRKHGVRFVIEIGNEPHNTRLASILGGQWNGRPPSPWLDRYVQLAHAAVASVKAVDRTAKLMVNEDMWVIHYWFLEAGLPRELDAMSVHPYNAPGIPERTAVAHDTDWTRPFTVVDPDRSFASGVRRLRSQGQLKLGRTPEIWVTEWGWPSAEGKETKGVPESVVASYLPRAFIIAAAAGVEVMCWFSAWDAQDGPMGLIRRDGTTRAAYGAFKQLAAQLGDHVHARHAQGQATPQAGIQAHVFDGPLGRKLVAWSADGITRRMPLPKGLGDAAASDAMGATPSLDTDASGALRVPVGVSPVYVRGEWTDAAIDASLAAAV